MQLDLGLGLGNVVPFSEIFLHNIVDWMTRFGISDFTLMAWTILNEL